MNKTNTILDEIVESKKTQLDSSKTKVPRSKIDKELHDAKPYEGTGFYDALKSNNQGINIIAEIKAASPSEGILRDPFDIASINDAYQVSDAVAAISVVTEPEFFKGSEKYLSYVARHNTNHKPLLRKDFIFDTYQIVESKLFGAQAYLLIASLFSFDEIRDLVDFGLSIGIEPLVEVHTAEELKLASATSARCIGVNSRDLHTFNIIPDAHYLLKELDGSYVRVAESGITSAPDIERISEFSDAALIGSHFMRSNNIESAINALLETNNVGKRQ